MLWNADTKAYMCYYSSYPALVLCGLEKIFYTFIVTYELAGIYL